MITENQILRKTHYGLHIYTYVLKQYKPELLLVLSGYECQPTFNPFLETDYTLKIQITQGVARHQDMAQEKFQGTAFDFARLYFKTNTRQELFTKIDHCLQLGLQASIDVTKTNTDQERLDRLLNQMPDSLQWDPKVSYYKAPIQNILPFKTVSLSNIHRLLTDKNRKAATEEFRAIKDVKQKKRYKSNLFDYVTFSGVFTKRNEKSLVKHSSLLTIDFDHLKDVKGTKSSLLQDPYFDTELLFTSPSGDGLKWIVKIDLSCCSHQNYFKAIANYIQKSYKIKIDNSGRDIARACYLPYDKDAFLHAKYQTL